MDVIKRKPLSYLGVISILAIASNTIFNEDFENFMDFNFQPIEVFIIIGYVLAISVLVRCLIYRNYVVRKSDTLIVYDIFLTKRVAISEIKGIKYPENPWQGTYLVLDGDSFKLDSYNLSKKDKLLLEEWIQND